jgi:hypothetical protein
MTIQYKRQLCLHNGWFRACYEVKRVIRYININPYDTHDEFVYIVTVKLEDSDEITEVESHDLREYDSTLHNRHATALLGVEFDRTDEFLRRQA